MPHQTESDDRLLDQCTGPDPAPASDCPVEITLAVLRGRWTALVLLEFFRHRERVYSQLATTLPALSDKVLSDRLAQLTAAGVLTRHRAPAYPPRVRYALTERGRALRPVIETLWDWGSDPRTPRVPLASGGHVAL